MHNDSKQTNSFGYAAFISYRHLPKDTEIACEVQHAIEKYRLPRHVLVANTPVSSKSQTDSNQSKHRTTRLATLGKCFRDEDELAASHSLPDSIQKALAASHTLIVICSPETQNSPWVQREIDMFEQIHGREHIICVLAAGTPEESIPSSLKSHLESDANGVMHETLDEPLAADLRTNTKAKRKAELLRTIAAVAGCSYDDLVQREQARKRKRIALITAIAILAIIIISFVAFRFNQTNEAALIAESKNLATQALTQYDQGERIEAIKTALQALPSSENDTSRPLVPEAQSALEKLLALNPDPEQPWVPFYLFEAEDEVVDIAYSEEGDWFALLDATGSVSVYNTGNGTLLCKASPEIFMPKSDTSPSRDWFIEAVSSSCLVMGNRTGEGGLAGFNPLTNKNLWNQNIYPLTVTSLENSTNSNSTNFGLLAYSLHSLAAALINEMQGNVIAGSEITIDQFPHSMNYDAFCVQQNPSKIYYALDKSLVSFDMTNGISEQKIVSDSAIQSVGSKDNLVIFTAANVENNNNNTDSYPFSITAIQNTEEDFETLWDYKDTFAVTVSTKTDNPQSFANLPRIIDIIHCGDDLALITAGKKIYAFNLKTGSIAFEEEFAASIVAAEPCFIETERYAISLALSDGTLNVISPMFDVTVNTDFSMTATPFTLDGALLSTDQYGNLVAFIHAADKPNRIYYYLFRPLYDGTIHEEYSLDELLDYAHQAIS